MKLKMNQTAYIFGAILLGTIAIYQFQPWSIKDASIDSPHAVVQEEAAEAERETAFSNIGLKTNTAISSIPLSEVLGGGPAKDGIPAILDPKFITVEAATEWLDDEGLGIIYEHEGVTRYYPYAILYWHEIANDNIGDHYFTVTFCPLCGSSIIFDRENNGEIDTFGVSGKLWESNLMMYDHKTESLWSQILGEAKVGDRTGEELKILGTNIITFAEVKENHPTAEVLSKETGHQRSYGDSPYGDYEENNSLFFPVSNEDEAFHKKELFYIVNVGEKSVGFMRTDLLEAGSAEVDVDGQTIRAKTKESGEITVTNLATEKELPGYIAMWFSWVTHINLERAIWPN
jgi:hypothetical protein